MIKILVKNRLRSLFGSFTGKRRDGSVKKASFGRILAYVLIIGIVLLSFLSISTAAAIALGYVLIPIGAAWLYFSIFILASLAIIFILSIFETKSELFECKDNELLLSMPIKPRDIVASRVSVVLIYNYFEELIIMLPCIIVYAVMAKDIVGVIGSIIVSLCVPLLATALSAAAGYGVAVISKKLRKNSFVTVAISLVFLLIYFVGYEVIVANMESFLGETAENGAVPDLPFLYYIGGAALLLPISTCVFVLASVLLFVLAYAVISKSYIKLVTNVGVSKRREYSGEQHKARGVLSALVRKEFKSFISSATYMLNCGMGLVFLVVVAVAAVLNSPIIMQLGDLIYTEHYVDTAMAIAPVMIAAIPMLSSFNDMSACALSLEGKNFLILKSHPISDREALLSKILPQIIISTPPTLLCSVLFIIASSAPVEFWAFYILTPIASNIFFAIFGLIMNIAFPKFDFENEAQPIKQSMSVFMALVVQMLLGIGVAVGALLLVFVMQPIIVALLTFALFLLLSVISWFILMGPAKRKYSRMEV